MYWLTFCIDVLYFSLTTINLTTAAALAYSVLDGLGGGNALTLATMVEDDVPKKNHSHKASPNENARSKHTTLKRWKKRGKKRERWVASSSMGSNPMLCGDGGTTGPPQIAKGRYSNARCASFEIYMIGIFSETFKPHS